MPLPVEHRCPCRSLPLSRKSFSILHTRRMAHSYRCCCCSVFAPYLLRSVPITAPMSHWPFAHFSVFRPPNAVFSTDCNWLAMNWTCLVWADATMAVACQVFLAAQVDDSIVMMTLANVEMIFVIALQLAWVECCRCKAQNVTNVLYLEWQDLLGWRSVGFVIDSNYLLLVRSHRLVVLIIQIRISGAVTN